MAHWNGLITSLTKDGSTVSQTLSGTSNGTVNVAVPAKFFKHGQFGIAVTQGVSGSFGVSISGGIGGATYVIAGRAGISAVGSFPVPIVLYGVSGTPVNIGIPRPSSVQFYSISAPAGFTASVFFAGDY